MDSSSASSTAQPCQFSSSITTGSGFVMPSIGVGGGGSAVGADKKYADNPESSFGGTMTSTNKPKYTPMTNFSVPGATAHTTTQSKYMTTMPLLPPTGTRDLMGLLGDLAQSRINVENDQKAYDQGRQELNALNDRLKLLRQKKVTIGKQITDVEMKYSELASELSLVIIKDKVLSDGLEKLQLDLVIEWDSLKDIRHKIFSVSGRYLGECTKFAKMYNCTELGSLNRTAALTDELEEKRLQKQQLEYDLQKFLSMMAEVEKSEKENKELQMQYRVQEETDRKRETEAYKKLSESERLLEHLENKKSLMDKQLNDEINKLQSNLDATKQAISYWERRVSENQRKVGHQKNLLSTSTVSSSTSPGIPCSSIRLGNGQIISTNNKTPRLAQYVRPTPHISNQQTIKEPPPRPQKIIQTKLPFNRAPVNPPFFRPTVPKFTSPCLNVAPICTPRPSVSVSSLQKPAPQPIQTKDKDDPFNDSFSLSQYFTEPSSTVSPYYSSNQNTSYPNPTSTPSSGPSRTFQFKKKSPETSNITGPTCRSVSVTLGTTPFSTFQNSRTVLQDKLQLPETRSDSRLDFDA